ncbi:MAG: TonB-dependent receptor [Cocleimonas sp.]
MKNNLTAMKIAFPLILLSTPFQTTLAADDLDDTVKIGEDGGLEITITANRRLQPVESTLASVTVITRKDIEQIQAQDVTDVLRLQTGVDVSRNGGAGSLSSVFLRGAESDQVLVLIDGIRVSSATSGAFDWSALPIDQVERIEIVRGPRTALYGSDAIGGVIQVFTKNADSGSGAYGSLTFGKYSAVRGSVGFAKSTAKTKFSFNVSAEDTDGFSATNIKAGAFVFNPDDDSNKKKSVNMAVSHQLNNKISIGFNALATNNDVEFDQGVSDTDVKTLQATVEVNSSARWKQKFTVGQSKNELLSRSSFGDSTFDTNRKTLNWQNDIKLSNRSTLILGLDYREDKGTTGGFTSFSDKISNKAAYANYSHQLGGFNLDLAGRLDNHSEFENEFTGQISGGYKINPSSTVYAGYGTGFRAPSINDLFSPGFVNFAGVTTYAGNPDLDPESSKNIEIGFKSQLSQNHRLEANIFRNEIEDMVSFTGIDNQAINSDEVTLKGIELSYKGKANKLDWALGATFQRADDISNNLPLVRRPNSKFTANLGLAMTNRTHVGVDAVISSSRQDNDFSAFPAQRVSLPSYGLVNFSVKHKLNKHLDLGLRVENITDEDYELAQGFNTSGRGAYFTLSYK